MLPYAYPHRPSKDRETKGRTDVSHDVSDPKGRWMLRNHRHAANVEFDNAMEYSTPYFQQLKERGIRLPAVLCQIRTDEGRQKRKQGIEVFRFKFLTPRTDHISNALTTIQKDNLIMTPTETQIQLTYHPEPTKEDLLEYFGEGRRIRIRKMAPDEAGKLMGLIETELEKINAYPFPSYTEREAYLATADEKEKKRIKHESILKTAKYRCYGNSIVVEVLIHLFRTMFIPNQPENATEPNAPQIKEYTIFDYL